MKTNKTRYISILKYATPAILVALLFITQNMFKDFLHRSPTKLTPTPQVTDQSIVNNTYLKQKIKEGLIFGNQGNIDQEISVYREILQEKQDFAPVHLHLGRALYHKKKYPAAVYNFKKALEIKPNYPTALTFLGMTLRLMDKPSEALEWLSKAIQLAPNYPDAHLQLSKAYYDLEKFDEALTYGYKAAKLAPRNVHVFLNLGHAYNKSGKLDFAVKMYKKALEIEPLLANAHYNLGYTLKILGKCEEALESLNKAIELQPDYVDAHLAKAQTLIYMENFNEGLEEFEWRWGLFGIEPMQYKDAMWDGSDPAGKTLVLRSEQGLGDTLQYIRYAKLVKDMGATVICKVQKPLLKILSSCPYIDKLITKNDEAETFDAHAQLMSLPRILKTAPDTIPAPIPYLQADPQLEKEWGEKLAKDKNIKIGLCWHVDPVHEKIKSPWSLRSITLEQFAPLANIKGVTFYSLQKLGDSNEVTNAPEGLVVKSFGPDFDKKHGSFMDSAAIIKHLDLIITVDTSVAHLAGGLNKPVWMMLPFAPDCRWYFKKDHTPWYPKMKLFRQETAGDWNTVMQRVAQNLSTYVASYKQS